VSFFIYCTSSECGDLVDRSRSRAETSASEHYHSPSIDDGMYFKATFFCCCLQHSGLVDLQNRSIFSILVDPDSFLVHRSPGQG